MEREAEGLKEKKLDLIRAINDEMDEARIDELASDLLEKGTAAAPDACAHNPLCEEYKKTVLELLTITRGCPEVFSDASLKPIATNTLKIMKGFIAAARATAAIT